MKDQSPKPKALSWKSSEGERVASTPFGTYRFFEEFSPVAGTRPVIVFACCDESTFHLSRDHGLTFDIASQIAQADFNARVLACLD